MSIRERLTQISERIRRAYESASPSVRAPEPPRLLAVSKGQPAEAVVALLEAGHTDFAENYVQELLDKQAEVHTLAEAQGVRAQAHWHFIDHLQSNKAKLVANAVDSVHSVDRLKIAQALGPGRSTPLPVYAQVNLDGEASKGGFSREELLRDWANLRRLPGISVVGLMCIPAPGQGALPFERLRTLASELQAQASGGGRLRLSMGMSDDFELAIAQGATDVRVGTALFGPRKPR